MVILPHYGKPRIVAIATFVTGLQMIAGDCYDRAIGAIGEGPGDRRGRGLLMTVNSRFSRRHRPRS